MSLRGSKAHSAQLWAQNLSAALWVTVVTFYLVTSHSDDNSDTDSGSQFTGLTSLLARPRFPFLVSVWPSRLFPTCANAPPDLWRSHGSPQQPLSLSPCPLGCLWTSHHPEARTSVGDATAFVTYCPTSHGKGTPEVDKGLWETLCKVSHRTKRIHVFNCLFKLSACWIFSIMPAQGGKSGLSQFTWVARTKYWFPCSFGGWTLRSGTSRVGSFQDLLPRLVDSYLFPVPSRHGNHLFSFAPWQPPPSCPFTRDGRLLPVPSYRDGLLFPVPSHHDGHLLPVFS